MASSEKTTNLQLNNWIGSDRSQREDFNADNEKIDAWAGEVNSQLNDITQNISNLENDKQDKLTYFNVKNYSKLENFIETDMTTLEFIKTITLNSITTVTHNNSYTYKLTDIPTPNGVLVVFRGVSDGYLNATMFGTNGKKYFYKAIVYDVSDTEVINPENGDKWSEEIGLINNLHELLNNAAIQFQKQFSSDENKSIEDNADNVFMDNVRKSLFKFFNKQGVTINDTGNDNETLAKAIFDFALMRAPEENTLKEENKVELAKFITAAVTTQLEIPNSITSEFLSKRPVADKYIAAKAYNTVREIISNIRMEINESVNGIKILSPKEFIEMMKKVGVRFKKTPEAIHENFFKFLERMDNSNKNLLL